MKIIIMLAFLTCHLSLISQTFIPRGQKVLIDTDNSLNYMASFDNKGIFVLKKDHQTNKTLINCTLAPINKNRKKYLDSPWSNFEIFENYIFDIVVNNSNLSRIPEEFIQNNPNKFSQNYFFECRDRSTHILENSSVYASDNIPLNLENISEIESPLKPVFNYDFIVENKSVSLIIIQAEYLYIYSLNGLSQLLNQEWKLLHALPSPFEQEYFLVTKNKSGDYTFHTKSQGEFVMENLFRKPILKKINERNLDERIFLTNRMDNSTYEITKENYHSLLESDDHVSHLNLILNSKN